MQPYTAAYLRVSSRKTTGKQRTDSQRYELTKYVRNHRIKPVKWFEDYATGRNLNRKQLSKNIDDCKAGKCDQIIMYKLDRLGRNAVDTVQVIRDLVDHGVKIVCISQGFTFDDSAMGRFVLTLMAAIAELDPKQAYYNASLAGGCEADRRAHAPPPDLPTGRVGVNRLCFCHRRPSLSPGLWPTRTGTSLSRRQRTAINTASDVAMMTLCIRHPHPAGIRAATDSRPTNGRPTGDRIARPGREHGQTNSQNA